MDEAGCAQVAIEAAKTIAAEGGRIQAKLPPFRPLRPRGDFEELSFGCASLDASAFVEFALVPSSPTAAVRAATFLGFEGGEGLP